jgi:hypothetical protein
MSWKVSEVKNMKSNSKPDPFVVLINKLMVEVFTLYFRLKRLFFEKSYYNNHHLSVTFKDWKLAIGWADHETYIKEIEIALSKLQEELSVEEFITQAILLCKNCNFLIFDCGNEGKFVQFWLGDGRIMGNWPMVKGNQLKKYTYPMLGVLNELGITRDFVNDGKWPEKLHHCYTLVKNKDFEEYVMNFGKDVEAVTEFTTLVMTKVFKSKLDKLKFKVG